MKHIQIFESFTRKMIDDQEKYAKEVEKKYFDKIREYLFEITDKFTPKIFRILDSKAFNIIIVFEKNELDRFFEVFHSGVFDRIKEEYPGTMMVFEVGIFRKVNNQSFSGLHFSGKGIFQNRGCYVECTDVGIDRVYNYLDDETEWESAQISIQIS